MKSLLGDRRQLEFSKGGSRRVFCPMFRRAAFAGVQKRRLVLVTWFTCPSSESPVLLLIWMNPIKVVDISVKQRLRARGPSNPLAPLYIYVLTWFQNP